MPETVLNLAGIDAQFARWRCSISRGILTKANGLNPETYLNHLLSVLPERFAGDPQAKVDDLMPWNEDMRSRFRA